MISTWFFWVRFSLSLMPRNLTKFVVLISMLLNIIVGSYHGTKTPFHFMKHNILSFFAFHEGLCQTPVTHKYLFTINYLEKCFCIFIRIKKVKIGKNHWQKLLDLRIFSLYEDDLQKLAIITVPKLLFSFVLISWIFKILVLLSRF